jgi:predicted metal-binding membrane protein
MPSAVAAGDLRPIGVTHRVARGPRWRVTIATLLVAIAWLIVVAAQATGNAALLHHHALLEDGPPLWLAILIFLFGWQAMTAAMMLPASLPTIRLLGGAFGGSGRPRSSEAAFLSGFALVSSGFGSLALAGDLVLHRLVDVAPWLASRPWLIEAAVLFIAGAWQFAPLKRRSLKACRHPHDWRASAMALPPGFFRLGIDHGLACLGGSWALMLLMFAEGFASLLWMAALTAVMVYETTGRHGRRAASAVGIVLLLAGLAVVSGPGMWAP